LEGTKESAAAFSGEVKEQIEISVTDAKLKSAEILGLTEEIVKQAVRKTIESGKDVEQTVSHITRQATERALAGAQFSAEKVKDVSSKVLSASVEIADEAGSHMKEVSKGGCAGNP
jgi:hypothetical protein